MNVSLQSTLSSKGICESELVRTYKMRQFGISSLAQEGKERKQTDNDHLTQGRWMEIVPINQMAHFIPRQEQRSVHSKRFVSPTHAYQGGQRWGLPSVVQRPPPSGLLRLAHLMQIPGPTSNPPILHLWEQNWEICTCHKLDCSVTHQSLRTAAVEAPFTANLGLWAPSEPWKKIIVGKESESGYKLSDPPVWSCHFPFS